eukprot:1320934-Alexandrium_andersonii.AAC.1
MTTPLHPHCGANGGPPHRGKAEQRPRGRHCRQGAGSRHGHRCGHVPQRGGLGSGRRGRGSIGPGGPPQPVPC